MVLTRISPNPSPLHPMEGTLAHRDIDTFAEIEPEFRERIDHMAFCVATIDTRCRPSTRILCPIREGRTGWIGPHRTSSTRLHLEGNPYVSLAWSSDPVCLGLRRGDCDVGERSGDPTARLEPWKITLAALAGGH